VEKDLNPSRVVAHDHDEPAVASSSTCPSMHPAWAGRSIPTQPEGLAAVVAHDASHDLILVLEPHCPFRPFPPAGRAAVRELEDRVACETVRLALPHEPAFAKGRALVADEHESAVARVGLRHQAIRSACRRTGCFRPAGASGSGVDVDVAGFRHHSTRRPPQLRPLSRERIETSLLGRRLPSPSRSSRSAGRS